MKLGNREISYWRPRGEELPFFTYIDRLGYIRYSKPGFGIAIPIWMPLGQVTVIAGVVWMLYL